MSGLALDRAVSGAAGCTDVLSSQDHLLLWLVSWTLPHYPVIMPPRWLLQALEAQSRSIARALMFTGGKSWHQMLLLLLCPQMDYQNTQ